MRAVTLLLGTDLPAQPTLEQKALIENYGLAKGQYFH